MKRRICAVSTVALLAVTFACRPPGPTFTVPLHAGFIVGTQISTDGQDGVIVGIHRLLQWEATSPSGCLSYTVQGVDADTEVFDLVEDYHATTFTVIHDTFDGSQGGGSNRRVGWNVVAHDCDGRSRTSEHRLGTRVWQEDGSSSGIGDGRPGPTITWTGSWTTQVGGWASGGRQQHTTGADASVTFTRDFAEAQHIAVVMAKGPGRGSAHISVDGEVVATVDTNAPANDNRRVVFDAKMTAGVHSLTVANAATPGHPRIDIDAFMT